MPVDILPSVCPHDCPSACALEVERIDGDRIGRLRGAASQTYTHGVVCAKVARYAERQHHPDRLSRPLRRVGGKGVGLAAFIPISWENALDEVAERLVRAAQRHGSEAVWPYYYSGTMGLVQRDGINRLRHAMRYSREDLTICSMLTGVGWMAGVGAQRGVDGREIAKSDLIVVWGGNPVSTQVNVLTHVAIARRQRGARLVVVDPYRTASAEAADLHLALLPGTDGALACAVMHVLFKEGYADRAYMARHADDPAGIEAHLAPRDPAWAAAITGLPEDAIIDFARLYGRAKRSYIRVGYGFSRSRNGAAQVFAVTCLPTVTGAWQYEGGGALQSNHGLASLDRTLFEGLDLLDPSIRILDQSRIGPVLAGDRRDLGDGPPVSALFIQNTNPMVVAPESGLVRQGFARDDLLVCVHEQFMTETAAMADIVVPATTFLEHDDFYTAGAHTYLQLSRAVMPPYAECRSNHDVNGALAQRLGAKHRGFEMTPLELIDHSLRASGLPGLAEFPAEGWLDCGLPFESTHFLDGFGHADKKFHFRADWAALGHDHARLPAFPDHVAVTDDGDPERPFRLVAAPSRSFLNTSFNNTPSSIAREGRPTALIHPAALAQLGIADGDRVRIGNDKGSVVVHARAFDGLQRRVVIVEGIWPNPAFVEGIGINLLISADPGLPRGGAVFHDTSVWLRPARGAGMSDDGKALPTERHSAEIADFLEKLKQAPVRPGGGRGRLIFALDATASREPSWDRACRIQGEMFEATAALGGLEIQLVFYRGFAECKASRWVTSAAELHRIMRSVHCVGGETQIERVLSHAIRETGKRRVNALVFVGDAMEEKVDRLCKLAGELGLLGVPIFLFHEGRDPTAAAAFKQIANLSRGAYLSFDLASAGRLKELLAAVAVYAAGGYRALAAYGEGKGGDVLQLTSQLKK